MGVSIKKSINTVILFELEEGLTEMNGMQKVRILGLSYFSSVHTNVGWGGVPDKI